VTDRGNVGGPSLNGAETLSELSIRLDRLRSHVGMSYRELHKRVVSTRRSSGSTQLPSFDTVRRCFVPGRTRLDVDLVTDIVMSLTGATAAVRAWRRAYDVIVDRIADAQVVDVLDHVQPVGDAFVGRRAELGQLVATDADVASVNLLDGMPGVGKTWLARRAAQEAIKAIRPEIVLTAHLRGYHAHRAPADPVAVLGEMLRLLAVPAARFVSLGLDARGALLRERLTGRRAVILLDDAVTDDQVTPLLVGAPGSLILVTSRCKLTRTPGTRHTVEVLSRAESVEALRRHIGSTTAEDDPVLARLAAGVAYLPLALTLIGSRVRNRPGWTLADHADRVDDTAQVLRTEHAVEAALDGSYRSLGDGARAMLRALSAHPGRHLDPNAAAAVADLPVQEARSRLTELAQANLIGESSDGRVEVHDLVRIFASARAIDDDTAGCRRSAEIRLTTFYTATAARAMDVWFPGELDDRPLIESTGVTPAPVSSPQQAADWLDAELSTLVAVALNAPRDAARSPAVLLSGTLNRFLITRGRYLEAEMLHARAVDVATGTDRHWAMHRLTRARTFLGRHAEASALQKEVLRIARETGDDRLEASTLYAGFVIARNEDRWKNLESVLLQALGKAKGVDRPLLLASIYDALGCTCGEAGRYDEAKTWFDKALDAGGAFELMETSRTLGNISELLRRRGQWSEVMPHAQRQLALATKIGDRHAEAYALLQIGQCLAHAGRQREAIDHMAEALTITTSINAPRLAENIDYYLTGLRRGQVRD
jgi:tetratricopeptide (TPR) repeat protein